MAQQGDGWASASPANPFQHTDLLGAVACELASRPIDEPALHQHVWTYVGDERSRGTSPGRVIITLTELVEQATLASVTQRQALMRSIILSCVEAYFGHLGGDVHGPAGAEYSREGHATASTLGRERALQLVP